MTKDRAKELRDEGVFQHSYVRFQAIKERLEASRELWRTSFDDLEEDEDFA
jgi:hypothetical protein